MVTEGQTHHHSTFPTWGGEEVSDRHKQVSEAEAEPSCAPLGAAPRPAAGPPHSWVVRTCRTHFAIVATRIPAGLAFASFCSSLVGIPNTHPQGTQKSDN
jgi:hypothetical protein